MTESPVKPAPILEYDSVRSVSRFARWRRRIVFMLILGTIGACVGSWIRPTTYRSIAYLSVALREHPNLPDTFLLQDPAPHVAALQSPQSLAAGVAGAKINGVRLTPAEVAGGLKVRAIPESRLIEIAYTGNNPTVVAAVTSSVMYNYTASVTTVEIVALPGPPIPARPQFLFAAAGLAIGATVGWLIASLRRR